MDLNSFISNANYLPWLIPVGPLLAFLIITLLTNRSKLIPASSEEYGENHYNYGNMPVAVVTDTSRVISIIVGMSGIVMAWLVSFAVVGHAFATEHLGDENLIASSATWFDAGLTAFKMGVSVDPLTTIMLIMVPLACTMIFIYSIGYMAHDPRTSRFFSLIALFAGAMLTLVVADNLLLLFVGWEVMGLCSYMLIGFWFEKESAYKAAIKAFMTTRIADVIMLLGIAYLYANTGTLNFHDILRNADTLNALAHTPAILFGGLGWSAASLIGTFLVIGTIGKSAQFPLHVWLPDAMEGPTPVSALIHAATMVAAGVYMLFRVQLSLDLPHDVVAGLFSSHVIAWVGGITSLAAALMATQQDDIKKILAYSTLSQLGYMVMAVGLVSGEAGMFHLFTHAWFKALLFLGSGAVIYACHHEQDIWKMGGLLKKMPITGFTFLIGFLALIAVPGTSGFFSKEQILEAAFEKEKILFWIAVAVAVLTPFYMTRLFVVAFLGKTKSDHADHAHEVSPLMFVPLVVLAVLGLIAGYPFIASKFAPAYHQPEELFHLGFITFVSIGAGLVGLISGFVLYVGKEKDP
ncbi:MAG: NADH-quinone oxidoreductase subunit L, partial [Chloroflexota bacterium]